MKQRKIYSSASFDTEDPDYIDPGDYFSRASKERMAKAAKEHGPLMDNDRYQDDIDRAGGYDRYIAREKKSRSIYSSSSLVKEFMRYHDDPDNYPRNPNGFDKMYDILNQYGDEDEDVDVVFKRAPLDIQRKMLDLIKPAVPYTTREGARKMYYDALDMDIENASKDYCDGVVDAIEALFASGWLNESEFRTDL